MNLPLMPLSLVMAVFAVGVVYIYYGSTIADRRRRELSALAVRRGFTFSTSASYSLASSFSGFGPLHTGQDSYAYNIVKGTIGTHSIFAFDYHYQTNTHVDKYGEEHAYHYTFSAVIASSDVPLKSLAIRPKSLLTDVAIGDNVIEFESAEFNDRYCVSAIDRRWAYDVLNARTIALLLDAPLFHIEFDYNGAIAYQGNGARLSVPEMEAAINLLTGILDGLPDYLVRQQRGES